MCSAGVSTTFGEFAKVIGEVIGKPITYVEVTLEQAEAAMKSRNMPDWLVAHLVSIARAGGKGAFSKENTAADPRHRRPRADHDAAVRAGFQGRVQLRRDARTCSHGSRRGPADRSSP